MKFDTTYLAIDFDALEENLSAIRAKAGTKILAVVKADAYGHGAVPVAKVLGPLCAFFGVSSVSEALELRRAGIEKPILILGHTPVDAFATVINKEIRPTIFSMEDALALSTEAQKQNKTARFHFAVDTGMSRIGFQATEEAADICAQIAKLPNLEAEGLFSHFATADCRDLTQAKLQAQRFAEFDQWLADRGVTVKLRHLDNSAGIMNFNCHYEMVRSGIVTYGLYPSGEVDPKRLDLKPAMSWYSHITHIKTLPAGRSISYGGTYTTTKDTVVATVPAGYADGYRRSLSNRFYVEIHGQKAPILGRVCMDQMMVDVTDIPDVNPGDTVVLMGGQISAEEIAAAADSFNYEFICGMSRRTPRLYYQGGKLVQKVNYLLDV